MSITFNIIGAGRLGRQLAYAIQDSQQATLLGVCNRSLSSSKRAVSAIGAGHAIAQLKDLPKAKITFITTQDEAIAAVAGQLANHVPSISGSVIAHVSGALNSDILFPVKKQGCVIASIHPLKAFCGNLQANAFQGVYCAVEGEDKALKLLQSLFSPLGARLLSVKTDKKSAYHAAAVLASNYLVTLANHAADLFQSTGLDSLAAKQITLSLMGSSLANLDANELIKKALTGPLMRGDIKTIDRHLKAIDAEVVQKLYRAAGLATLPLTDLEEEKITQLKALLD